MFEDLVYILQRWTPVLIIGAVLWVCWSRMKELKKRFGGKPKDQKKEHFGWLRELIDIIKNKPKKKQCRRY